MSWRTSTGSPRLCPPQGTSPPQPAGACEPGGPGHRCVTRLREAFLRRDAPPASTVGLSSPTGVAGELDARRAGLLCTWPSPAQAPTADVELPLLSPCLPFPVLLTKTQSEPSLGCRGTVSRVHALPAALRMARAGTRTGHGVTVCGVQVWPGAPLGASCRLNRGCGCGLAS